MFKTSPLQSIQRKRKQDLEEIINESKNSNEEIPF